MNVTELITKLTEIQDSAGEANVVFIEADTNFEYSLTSVNFDGVDKVELIFDGPEE